MTEPLHGGRLHAARQAFGGALSDWLDLSTGINPQPYPVGSIASMRLAQLPDEDLHHALVAAARSYYRVPDTAEIVAASGTQSIISLLPRLFQHRRVAVWAPTYNEHGFAWGHAGHDWREVTDLDQIADEQVVVLVNPNNPNGHQHRVGALIKLAKEMQNRDGLLVVDEAFCDNTPDLSLVPDMNDHCILLRSFGKFFGLAGLRLGFAICGKSIAEQLRLGLGPWHVSSPALVIGARAMADEAWIESAKHFQSEMSFKMRQLLSAAGFETVGGTDLFNFVRHTRATEISHYLKTNRILVREFESDPSVLRFGLCPDEPARQRFERCLMQAVHD